MWLYCFVYYKPKDLEDIFCVMVPLSDGKIRFFLQLHPNCFSSHTLLPTQETIPISYAVSRYDNLKDFCARMNRTLMVPSHRMRAYTYDEFIEYFGLWLEI